MATAQAQTEEPIWSLLPFWFVAFAAAGLFATVTIAPALEHESQLTARVHHLAVECRHLSETNNHLERVIDAFRHDPEFTAELARSELDYGLPDEQRLPAPPKHHKQADQQPREASMSRPLPPILQLFAHDRLMRHAALLTAAALTVVGFTFFSRTHNRKML